MKTFLVAFLIILLMTGTAAADQTVQLSELHYGEEAFSMHTNNQANTVTLDGITYEFEDDDIFSVTEPASCAGGKTHSVYEYEMFEAAWRTVVQDPGNPIATVSINPSTPVILRYGDGNRVSGVYTLSDPIELTDALFDQLSIATDGKGNPYLIDRIYLYSYQIGETTYYHAASVYINYENFTALYAGGVYPDATAANNAPASTAEPAAEETAAGSAVSVDQSTSASPKTEEPDAQAASSFPLLPVLCIGAAVLAVTLSLLRGKSKGQKQEAARTPEAVQTPVAPKAAPRIADEQLSRKDENFRALCEEIRRVSPQYPEKARQIEKFFNYYEPTAQRLIDHAVSADQSRLSDGERQKATDTASKGMDIACTAAQKLLDHLFSDKQLQADADIAAMETIAKMDGLSGDDSGRLSL